MPFRTKLKRAEYMRRYRSKGEGESEGEGGKPRKPSVPTRKPFIRERVNPDLLPLELLAPGERAKVVRKAMIKTMGLTREAYERNLEARVATLEALVLSYGAEITRLSWAVADMQADTILWEITEEEVAYD